VNWQHVFSAQTFVILSIANSEQEQHIVENDQLESGAAVYNERTSDRITTAKYDWTTEHRLGLMLTTGSRMSGGLS
jgi:hypothetical protein